MKKFTPLLGVILLLAIVPVILESSTRTWDADEIKGSIVDSQSYDYGDGSYPLYVVQLSDGTKVDAKVKFAPLTYYKVGAKVIVEGGQTLLLRRRSYRIVRPDLDAVPPRSP